MTHAHRTEWVALLVVILCATAAAAQPQGPQPWWPTQPRPLPFLHPLFSDGAVIQRDATVAVWGWSKPGDEISVAVDGKPTGAVATVGNDGRWTMKLGPFPAGGPHTIAVAGKTQKETIRDVLFGDVWLCSGQSNMNWPVRLTVNAEEELKKAKQSEIRSFTVGFYPSLTPTPLPPPARWEVCTPENARNFTAVGYFFAREIHATQKVPIGIIHASAGATAAEAWTSGDALRRHMPFDFRERLGELKQAAGPDTDYFAELEKWVAVADPVSAKKKYTSDPDLDTTDWTDIAVPRPWGEAGLKDVHGLVWFRRSVDVPEAWAGKDLLLALSVVNDADIVWFNGKLVGATQTAGTGRTYLVDGKFVRQGKNLLTVAVVNKDDPAGFCSNAGNMVLRCPANPADASVKLAGTWKAKPAVKLADLAPVPTPRVGNYKTITALFNGMIAPLTPFAIKGVLWYQGESNWPFWLQYRRLLPTLIADWRTQFGGDIPFLVVSLAGYNALQTKPVEAGWAEIRESQWRTVRRVPNTGLAMTIDIGDAKDIHPRNKQEVGRRLSLIARNLVYGEKELVCSGPEFTEMMIEPPKSDRIRLYFKHLGGGLMLRADDKVLTGFAIAGADKNFVWADAVIDGDTVVVSSPDVPAPKYVRYGWASNPVVNLYNKAGLPAVTFRTDE